MDPGYQPRQRWLTVEEVDLLVEELSEVQPHYAGAVAFAVATGARRSEIARATREDIEAGLESGQVQIHGSKTLKSRQPVLVLSIFRGLLERSLAPRRPDGGRSACGCCRATRGVIPDGVPSGRDCARDLERPAPHARAMAATSWRVGGTDR